MKKIIALLIIIFASQNAKSQTIFAPDSATWYYSGEQQLMAGYGTRVIKYKTASDTTIQSKNCKKIISTEYNYHQSSSPYNDTLIRNPEYIYTSNDTVFYYNAEYNRFLELYYFNVSIGDTLKYHIPTAAFSSTDTIFRVVVDSITTLNISSFNLKRIWTTPIDDFQIPYSYVERIGADYSFGINSHEYVWMPSSVKGIRCYSDNDISYNFETVNCDYLITVGTFELEGNINNCIVFPNPATTTITIENIKQHIQSIRILDLLGREVFESIKNEVLSTKKIDVSKLPKGMYILQLQTKNGVQSKKFMKE